MKQVEIPNDYFLNMSKKDYSHFETAIIREFFQNSVDAGAKQFVIDFDSTEKTLTIFDDGCGMDKDTIVNKLLVMGKSHKDNDNAIGAFGHAKILLYFSWPKWEIRTRNYIVSGVSHYYEIAEVDDYVDGVISTIWVEDNIDSIFKYHCKTFFVKCDTSCKVFYNDSSHGDVNEELIQYLKVGESIYDDENFTIHTSNQKDYYITVRQNGVFMFQEYLSSHQKTMAVVEIKGRPEKILLQNRDYFKQDVKEYFNKIKREFEVDSVETFTTNHDTKTPFNSFDILNNDIHSLLPIHKVITHGMEEKDSYDLLNKYRAKRLLNIAYAYINEFKEFKMVDNVVIGYTNKPSIVGLFRYNGKTEENEIYFNLNYITENSPNYRKMAIILMNTLIHEYAHAYNVVTNNSTSHDEEFVKMLDQMHDYFWDKNKFIKIFKTVWKETKRGSV
jgi:hypothetical protein